jgi:putative MATE family efflux protein
VVSSATLRSEVLRLAVPALLSLVVEPLFLLADSAIIGHLGTVSLAALGVASTALLTASGVFVFLSYATTATAARRLGAGQPARAVAAGLDGLYLALALGAGTGAAMWWASPGIVDLVGAGPQVGDQAVTYLRISSLGLPAMLAVLAVTGVLRGLQDTRTPMVVSVIGFAVNAALNWLLVYPAGLGIAGSAWGTVLAQTGMAAALGLVLLGSAHRYDVRLAPHRAGVLSAARAGVPLLVRTLALRMALLLTVWAAAGLGTAALAAHQVAFTVWTTATFALDSLAIAAQALTGKGLGAGDIGQVRAATALMVRWGVAAGAGIGLTLILTSAVVPNLFTTDPQVRAALSMALVVVGLGQPLSGYLFVLDGVLIGAGDTRWLARAMALALACYAPVVVAQRLRGDELVDERGAGFALALLWIGFTAFLGVRALTLRWRVKGSDWLVTGA